MRILIADDDAVSRTILERTLAGWGHESIAVGDGLSALELLSGEQSPPLAILDWMMPGLEGPEVCRRLRSRVRAIPTYLILLTGKHESGDIVAGLDSGADDYVTKPFDRNELQSRIKVGERMLALQRGLADRVLELEDSLAKVKQLQGLLPICAWCKSVRNDGNYWQTVEAYMLEHADVRFTHGICPKCLARETGEEMD